MMRRLLAESRRHLAAALLLFAAGAIYLPTQSSFGMFMWDESEYAGIARSLLRGGGFEIAGRPSALRPPLLPLAGAASMHLRGVADDRSAKLATLALALVALAIVYVVTTAMFDTTTALFASFLVATTPEFWRMTAQFLSEVPFLGFFSAAVLGFELGLRRSPRWFWFSWIGWALALLTRYTAMLFVPFVLIRLSYSLLIRRQAEAPQMRTSSFLLAPMLAAAMMVPWLWRQQSTFGNMLIGFRQAAHQLQLYLPEVSMPWHFYFTQLPNMLSPATTGLLVLGAVWAVWRRQGYALVCLLVTVGLLLWFSVYRYKEVRLVTAIIPFAAIVAAAGISQLLRGRWRLLLFALAAVIFVWNRAIVRPIFSTVITRGYPALLEATGFIREHTWTDAVVMAATVPQTAWYADRPVVDFPEAPDLMTGLASCEWALLTNFERGQKPYVFNLAKQLAAMNVPGSVAVFHDPQFIVVLARADFLRAHLPH